MVWFLILTADHGDRFPAAAGLSRAKPRSGWRGSGRAPPCGACEFSPASACARSARPPKGGVLVASKHMSMWDTLALYLALDDPAIVLKRELLRIPFYGWYLWKAAAIPIDRGAGAERFAHA